MKLVFTCGVCRLLPICLVWLLVACVGICSSHSEEAIATTNETEHSRSLACDDAECCSITDTESLQPERGGFSITVSNGADDSNFSITTGQSIPAFGYPVLFCSPSPPLKFSGILQI